VSRAERGVRLRWEPSQEGEKRLRWRDRDEPLQRQGDSAALLAFAVVAMHGAGCDGMP
jgi:hypothetical protein